MRFLYKIQIDTIAGNAAIQSGKLPEVIQYLHDKFKPEAMYFTAEDGMRTCLMFVNIDDVSQIPSLAEPAFQALDAGVYFTPVMTHDDLKKGIGAAAVDFKKWM